MSLVSLPIAFWTPPTEISWIRPCLNVRTRLGAS